MEPIYLAIRNAPGVIPSRATASKGGHTQGNYYAAKNGKSGITGVERIITEGKPWKYEEVTGWDKTKFKIVHTLLP